MLAPCVWCWHYGCDFGTLLVIWTIMRVIFLLMRVIFTRYVLNYFILYNICMNQSCRHMPTCSSTGFLIKIDAVLVLSWIYFYRIHALPQLQAYTHKITILVFLKVSNRSFGIDKSGKALMTCEELCYITIYGFWRIVCLSFG
jgi:putative component of membrane protein insertase Oxa1/YidC/SpoIIIJ protein YidD